MTLITFQDGQVVMRDGQVGTEQGCCCQGGVCCGPDCRMVWPVDFLPDDGMQAAFTAFLEGRGYSNIEYGVIEGPQTAFWSADCCKSDPGDTDTFTVTGEGNSTTFTVERCLVNKPADSGCVEGLTPEECQALSGTVAAASSCAPNPCGCPPGFEPRVQKAVGLYLDDPALPCPPGFARIEQAVGPVECRGYICLESVTPEQWLACQDADPNCPGYNCIFTASCAEYQDFINANGGGMALANGILAWTTESTLPCCEIGIDCCDSAVQNPLP